MSTGLPEMNSLPYLQPVSQGPAGSSDQAWPVRVIGGSTGGGAGGSTVVDIATMPSVTLANPSTAVTVTNPSTAVTVTNPTTLVTVSNPGGASPSSLATRTSLASSVEGQLIAANANRKGAIIQNGSTASNLLIGLSTAVVSSAAYSLKVAPNGYFIIGGGGMPEFTGPVRARLESTALAGVAYGTELT